MTDYEKKSLQLLTEILETQIKIIDALVKQSDDPSVSVRLRQAKKNASKELKPKRK